MGILDRWKKPPVPTSVPTSVPSPAPPTAAEPGAQQERLAGDIGVTLLAVEDPFDSEVINGHASEAYRRGDERLVSFEVLLRNTSPTEKHTVGAGKFHLFDDQHFARESLTCDSRARAPAVIEGFLLPGARLRGWVTFCLPWSQQAARLQFFTGYLGAGVVAFDLPLVDGPALVTRRATSVQRRARAKADRQLAQRESEVVALEAHAEALREREAEFRALEARAERARQASERAGDRAAQEPGNAAGPPGFVDDE